MIRYALKCGSAHEFESWFASADAYKTLADSGMVACPQCGSTEVTKMLMAPPVRPSRKSASTNALPAPRAEPEGPLRKPASVAEAKLAAMRDHLEKNADYVGMSFAAEARKMHEGEVPQRSIYGEAKLDEAKALLEDGVPVAPLPFIPRNKTS